MKKYKFNGEEYTDIQQVSQEVDVKLDEVIAYYKNYVEKIKSLLNQVSFNEDEELPTLYKPFYNMFINSTLKTFIKDQKKLEEVLISKDINTLLKDVTKTIKDTEKLKKVENTKRGIEALLQNVVEDNSYDKDKGLYLVKISSILVSSLEKYIEMYESQKEYNRVNFMQEEIEAE